MEEHGSEVSISEFWGLPSRFLKNAILPFFTQGPNMITQEFPPVKEARKLPLCSRCQKLPWRFLKNAILPFFTQGSNMITQGFPPVKGAEKLPLSSHSSKGNRSC